MADIMTLKQVEEYLNVSGSTVRRMIEDRQIPAFKIRGGWRVRKAVIDAWILKNEKKTGDSRDPLKVAI